MTFNLEKLQQEINAEGLPADAGDGYVTFKIASPTQQQIDTAAGIIASHDPSPTPNQLGRISGKAALVDFLDNNADLLKYGDYFFSRAKLLSAQWFPPRDTNLTTLTTATVTIMQGSRTTDTDHNAMWRIFLWKLRVKYNIFNTEDELPAPPLTAVQARQVLIEADSFIKWGVDASHILLTRGAINGNGG